MFSRRTNADPSDRGLRRFVAGGSVALLLPLAMAAARPAVHQWLHGDPGPEAGATCAVALCATGAAVAAPAVVVPPPGKAWRVERVGRAGQVFVAAPRHFRQPERGSPLS